ncbi:MAG: universal stress protein [Gammaproteobacteria bacterium]|nr:MAG: universal stress protein [Gammaproteobacteria bacterium]
MFAKVLVMSDGTPISDSLLECVAGLKAVGCREAVLCHVIDVETAAGLQEEIRERLAPRLEQQRQWLAARGIDATIEMPLGLVQVEVNRLVAEQGCTLVAVATHSHNLARDLLIGVTACSVLRHARVPVLLARVEVLEQGARCRNLCGDLFRHLLVPTDFSANAETVLKAVERIASVAHPEVTLLHVQDRHRLLPYLEGRLEEFDRTDQGRLEEIADRLRQRGAARVETTLELGHPTEVILREANGGDYSLIVMGTHGRGFFSREILGGVAHRIANHAPQPVLFIPPDAESGQPIE